MKRINTTIPTKPTFDPNTQIEVTFQISYKELCAVFEQLYYTSDNGKGSPGSVVKAFRSLLGDAAADAGLPGLESVPVDRHLTHKNAAVTFNGWPTWPTVWPE